MGAISTCRLCKHKDLTQILSLGVQSFTGIFRKDLTEVPKGPLDLMKCMNCDLVQLKHSADPAVLFGETYGYRSGLNKSMVEHLGAMADELRLAFFMNYQTLGRNDLVIDIGSNDGTFLENFSECERMGIDPLITKFKQFYEPSIKLIPDFFKADKVLEITAGKKAKLVSSIAMLYDLEDPCAFAKDVAKILHEKGIWFFEQSYLPTMLKNVAFDTICHEHLEYYALKQIKMIVEQAGLVINKAWLTETNGGSIAVTASRGEESYISSELQKLEAPLSKMATYETFAKEVDRVRIELKMLMANLIGQGKKVFGYGASTKGNVILQYCGFTNKHLPVIAEVNEDKIGAFTPGTGIQIVSEDTARKMRPDYFLVLPYHFKENIRQRERQFVKEGGQLIFPLPRKPSIVKS